MKTKDNHFTKTMRVRGKPVKRETLNYACVIAECPTGIRNRRSHWLKSLRITCFLVDDWWTGHENSSG